MSTLLVETQHAGSVLEIYRGAMVHGLVCEFSIEFFNFWIEFAQESVQFGRFWPGQINITVQVQRWHQKLNTQSNTRPFERRIHVRVWHVPHLLSSQFFVSVYLTDNSPHPVRNRVLRNACSSDILIICSISYLYIKRYDAAG